MAVIPVYVFLEDQEYEKKLCQYLSRRYHHVFQMIRLREKPAADPLSSKTVNSILPSTRFVQEEPPRYPGSAASDRTSLGSGVYLYDRDLSTEEENQYRQHYGKLIRISVEDGIDPYQSADDIAAALLENLKHPVRVETPIACGRGRVMAIYSACGGAGVSTLSLTMAHILAKEHKTLLVPVAEPSGYGLFVKHPGGTLTDLLYYLLTEEKEMVGVRLREITSRQEAGFDYLGPMPAVGEMDTLTPEDLETLVEVLTDLYEAVVLDFPSTLGEAERELILLSSDLIEVIPEEPIAEEKRRTSFIWEDFDDRWVVYRGGRKREQSHGLFDLRSKRDERAFCVPEEEHLFVKNDARWQLQKDSDYWKAVEEGLSRILSSDEG